MVDDQIAEAERVKEDIEMLVTKRRNQCARLARLAKTPTQTNGATHPEDKGHLASTYALLWKDRATLLNMSRAMTKIIVDLERLRVTIRSADEIDACRNILEQTRARLASLSRTQGEVEVLVEEMNESTACLQSMDALEEDDMSRIIIDNLPNAPVGNISSPKLYSSIASD